MFVQPNDEGGAIHIDDVSFGVVRPDPVTVTPASFQVTRGTYISGGIAELADSDNADLQIVRSASDVQSRVEYELEGVSPNANPLLFEVELESSVFARSSVTQTIYLYNFDTDSWEPVDSRPASRFVDATVSIAANGDLSRFVESETQLIRARVSFLSFSARQQFAANTDAWSWTIQ